MKKILCISLAALVSSSVAFAQTVDNNAYKSAKEKAESDYKAAKDNCKSLKHNAKDVCKEEAKVAQARAELDATTQYQNTPRDVEKAKRKLADAEYDLAKERCDDMSGSAKSTCKSEARTSHSNALAATTTTGTTSTATTTTGTTATTGSNATGTAATGTTATLADTAREKASDTSVAMSDTMITTKVKAEMAADPQVKAMDVHVETQKGVVMLSGFVPTKAEADKAVELARKVQGVTDVKSSLQVKK